MRDFDDVEWLTNRWWGRLLILAVFPFFILYLVVLLLVLTPTLAFVGKIVHGDHNHYMRVR